MRLNEVNFSDAKPFQGYGPGFFRIGGEVVHGALLAHAGGVDAWGGFEDTATLLALKGEYETVKSAYQELIKPARSARGKHIAQVYYVKGEDGDVIRYRQPGDSEFSRLTLDEVEQRLAQLKAEHGENLYVKIIIPEDSGLTYNEAWEFMRNLLVKYDYYYQD